MRMKSVLALWVRVSTALVISTGMISPDA